MSTDLVGVGGPGSSADVVARFNEAFNSHDLDAVMTLVTDDCVFEDTTPPDGQRHVGSAAVREAWRQLFEGSPQAYFVGEQTLALGERVVVCWRYEWGRSGSEDAGHVRGVDVLTVRDGLVAEKISYVKG